MSSSSQKPNVKVVQQKKLQTKKYAFHAHDYREVLRTVASREEGLSDVEVQKRQREGKQNTLTKHKQDTFAQRVLTQFQSPVTLVLVLAFLLTAALGEYIDATVISLALLVAVAVGVFQEGKASQAFQKLAASQTKVATVLRNNKRHEIPASEIVIGDIVELSAGAQVPADVRIIYAKQLHTNEAVLTGEWQPVAKTADPVAVGETITQQASMAWKGTFVSKGFGYGVVVALGDQTQVGSIASSLQDVAEVETPLQAQMKKVSTLMLSIIGILVLLVLGIGLLQQQSLHDMLLMSIAIAVASIPEGLPAAVTIVLAIGMASILKRGGLVRNLLAAETLGSTTYVLTDKTGTLTEAQMSITGVLCCDGEFVTLDKNEYNEKSAISQTLDIALCASNAYTEYRKGQRIIHGDDVEKAILAGAERIDIKEQENSLRAKRTDYTAFTSENRYAAGLSHTKEGEVILCVNAAPEIFIQQATQMVCHDEISELQAETKMHILQTITRYTERGKRLLAVGYKIVSYDEIPESDSTLLQDSVLVGVLVIDDPIRKDIKVAIQGVQSAGARVVLITGDNPQTALSVAQEAGIANKSDVSLTGDDIMQLSDEELLVALRKVPVFARILPQQKLRIAMVLQQAGEIVAMTGDGVNDAPALQRANIGIAVGSGTDVAKEASDLVLVDNSFQTIYAAIEEGRRITANLQKIIAYLLSTSLTEVALIVTALLTSAAVPILPAQILWANMIEEGLMSVAFAFEKGDKNAMKQKPHDVQEEGIFTDGMLWFLIFVITVLSMITVALYFYVQELGLSIEYVRSIMFLSISIDSLFLAFAFRSLTTPVWNIPLHTNIFFLISFLVSAVLFAIVLTIPFFQYLLSYTPLPWELLQLPLLAGLLSLFVVELGKLLFFERR